MDDRIGRLVAKIGDDRTAAVMAAGLVVRCLREKRLAEAAYALASPRPAAGPRSTLILSHSSGTRTETCAAGETVGAIFRPLHA
jgi:hypothetical protein